MHSPAKPLAKIQSFRKPSPAPAAKQTLQEWHAAGGGIPTQYKGREHVWHAMVDKFAKGGEVHMAGAGDPLDQFSPPRYRSAGRRPESQNDRRAAANMPMDLARGVVSGIGGAPGDIESLIRMLPGLDEKTVLPTSEDIEKRLPFRSDTPAGRAATGLGTLAGGLYMGPGAPIRLVGGVPQAVYKAGKDFGRAAGQPATRLDVYHGSPYKYNKFDASKIGTGEGAQAYGHGIYTAENPGTAQGYQATLGHKGALDLEQEAIQRGIPLSREAKVELMRQSMRDVSPKMAVKNLQNASIDARNLDPDKLAALVKDYMESKQGSFYKVDLPDEQIAKMLDWDKPLSQQSAEVQKVFGVTANGKVKLPNGEVADASRLRGESAYRAFAESMSGDSSAASAKLRELGIPGIKYLDANSRGGGQGTRNFVTFPGEEHNLTILERNGQPMIAPAAEGMAGGGAPKQIVEAGIKGVKKLLGMADEVPKGVEPIVVKPKVEPENYSQKVLDSTAARLAEKIAAANPKMKAEKVAKKAMNQATKKLDWERTQKPALEKRYGALAKSSFAESGPAKKQNTPEVVQERMRKANEFLDIPTEAWTPPRSELQAFDRSSIKDALEGFPGVEQSKFPRDIPPRANIEHVEGLYTDPANRALIEKQIKRGLPLGGESFYASLYPVKQAVLEAGMPAEKFDQWIHSLAPASARNSIMNEMAVGQFLRNMNARGIPLTEENVAREMEIYAEKFGVGLPLMPVHRQGVENVVEGGQNLRDMSLANIPTNYKIPTYGSQKAGDFANSVVLDVHEAAGQTQGSRFHPYFNEQGGFGNTEYNAGEQGMLGIANELGIPGGMAQAGRWFGGGELTGLKSPRGDALDLLEKQVAYTLQQKGVQPNPANVRAEVLRQIETGEGDLLPWYRKEGMPDVRQTGLQRAEGGDVHMAEGGEVHMDNGGDPRGEMRAYDPTIRERMADALQRGIEGLGGSRYKARRTAQTFMGGPSSNAPMNLGFADVVPFLGTALGVDEGARDLGHAYDAVKRGDYVDAAANTAGAAAGLIPGAAGTIKGIKGGLEMARQSPALNKAAENVGRGYSLARVPVERPFTPLVTTVEATAPDLGQGTTYGFRQGLNDVLLQNPQLGNRPNKIREGQGTFTNEKNELELNPMLAIDVQGAGSIGDVPNANKALRQQIAQMGVDLNQEAMAAHRFIPLATNNVRDASSALIKTKEGLTPDEIAELAKKLGGKMAVTHNPKLGGVVVFPFGSVREGLIPRELLRAQQAADDLLGKRGQVQFGISDFGKDRAYLQKSEGDYTKAGALPMSKEQQKQREKLQGLEKFLFPASRSGIPGQVKAAPVGGLQPWSVGPAYPTSVIGIGNGNRVQYQPVNFSTGKEGARYDKYLEAEAERATMLDEYHRALVPKYR